VLALTGFLNGAPPLSLDGLRDEKLPEAPAETQVEFKANQSCYVCHGNLKEDVLVLDHAKQKIGCIRCHGDCVDHRNDEDNITPPDKMFPAETIDRMCVECHPHHNVPGKKVLERLRERDLLQADPKDLLCTSCHYQHRLAHRVVRWDKKTGKLLMREVKAKANLPPAPKPTAAQ